MNNGFATACPAESQDVVRTSYRQGYMEAQANKPVQIKIINQNGPSSRWMCKESFGEKICGYNCLEAYGKVKCARTADHTCLDDFGNIRCGLNCRHEYGEFKCDEYD
jgi:hypothetical protein